jgi:hypothetical protein
MNIGAENMNVNIPSGFYMNVLLAITRQLIWGRFLSYSARDNNCQSLILAILQSNNPYIDISEFVFNSSVPSSTWISWFTFWTNPNPQIDQGLHIYTPGLFVG